MSSPTPPPRVATLVLVDATGALLGALAPIEVATPWWMDMAPLVEAIRDRDGLRVVLLRLLGADKPAPHGGAVTYLAQCDRAVDPTRLLPWAGTLTEHPLRLAYARPGGPEADLAWATDALAAAGIALTGEPRQVRTWSLSSLWQLPTSNGGAWLKVVPPFFAHEGAMLRKLADGPVPQLIAHDGARMLTAHVPGADLYHAHLQATLAMVELLVDLQRRWLGRADELLALGLPDWRANAFTEAITALIERRASNLHAADRATLFGFVAALPARFEALASCGLPDGLVHSDFYPGNLRGGDGARLTLLDWGDCGVGHPLLDQAAFLDHAPAADLLALRAHWAAEWRRVLPRADIERATELLLPIASARHALIYQRFLDHIEDSEHPYHRADVPDWLHRTVERMRGRAAL